jgi:hypothetical protein
MAGELPVAKSRYLRPPGKYFWKPGHSVVGVVSRVSAYHISNAARSSLGSDRMQERSFCCFLSSNSLSIVPSSSIETLPPFWVSAAVSP